MTVFLLDDMTVCLHYNLFFLLLLTFSIRHRRKSDYYMHCSIFFKFDMFKISTSKIITAESIDKKQAQLTVISIFMNA